MAAIKSNTLHVFWQHHIAQWQASGLSQAGYCRQQELCAHQFSYWKRQLQEPCQSVVDKPKAGFTRVQLDAHDIGITIPASSGLSVHFKDGTQLSGITLDNVGLVKQLLVVLR